MQSQGVRSSIQTFGTKSRSTTVFARAMATGNHHAILAALPNPIKVVGMGSAGVDYLAQVAAYPQPDEKLRTERLEVQGGGNCGNALTAAARLGLNPFIVTKIGDDGVGDGIITEFRRDGVEIEFIIRAKGSPSPFTYIIVDRQGATRTCIHTPGEAFYPEEMTENMEDEVLKDAALVYFDGRLTEAALLLAKAAKRKSVPVLVEAERLRPGLDELLQEADYVVTSAHFPQNWTGEECLGDALAVMFSRLPSARWMITTLGKKGSVLLERSGESDTNEQVVAEEYVEGLFNQANGQQKESKVVCKSGNGIEILAGSVLTVSGAKTLCLKRGHAASDTVTANAAAAAAKEASSNADGSNSSNYAKSFSEAENFKSPSAVVTVAEAAKLPSDAVLDTTGAGDAFIGSVLYCLATGKSPRDALKLGAVVAACKCTALGARPGLPNRSDIDPSLL